MKMCIWCFPPFVSLLKDAFDTLRPLAWNLRELMRTKFRVEIVVKSSWLFKLTWTPGNPPCGKSWMCMTFSKTLWQYHLSTTRQFVSAEDVHLTGDAGIHFLLLGGILSMFLKCGCLFLLLHYRKNGRHKVEVWEQVRLLGIKKKHKPRRYASRINCIAPCLQERVKLPVSLTFEGPASSVDFTDTCFLSEPCQKK